MKVGVFGTGVVGHAIAGKLVRLGHEVMMGSRTSNNEKAADWVKKTGAGARQGDFTQAARFGELLFNCTLGVAALEVLQQAGADNLNGKVLIDVSNPLDFSKGMPPTLAVCNTDSLGEQIQRRFPQAKVVKTLHTVNCNVMVQPALVPGEHDMFMSGNDADAKTQARRILQAFGWKNVIDLGDIGNARATEMLLPIWVRLWSTLGTANFNFKVVRD